MSSTEDFILNWLNQTLNIQPSIKNIPKEFSNGYKFALLLNTLNEITNEELIEFNDSNNIKEIKSNFKKIKTYFHTRLNLYIREDEFNEVINKDVSKSVVILYKIKNSVQKKKINFLEIKTSDIKLTQEELNLKIQELMRETTKDNIEDKEKEKEKKVKEIKESPTPRKEVYNKFTIRKMFDGKSELNPIESVSSGLNKNKKLKKNSDSNNDDENLNELNLEINDSNNQTIGTNSENKNLGNNNIKTLENNSIQSNKKLLPKIKIKKNLKGNFKYINITDAKEKENDFFNDYGMMKINELRNKSKLEELKKLELKKEALKNINPYEPKERYRIDFIKKLNSPIYKFTKSTGINVSKKINPNYNSYTKRYEYSKEYTEIKKRAELNKEILNIKKLINKDIEEVKRSQKIYLRPLPNPYSTRNSHSKFNKVNYLNQVDLINIEEYTSKKAKRYSHIKQVYPYLRNVVSSIIDLTEDIYEYQQENEKEVLDLEDFQKFIELFITNKQKKKTVAITKSESIDNINNIKKLDPNTLKLKDEEKFLIQDYINYIGIWDKKKIIENEEKAITKFDIKKIKPELPQDYEPTKNELDDITIPYKLNDNYLLGNTLLNLIETKYNNLNDENHENKNDENININKWDYIPYKISILGYPLSGRKLIAENLGKKYPNLKVYSIKKIFREYYTQYKDLTEKIEGNPKYNNLKPNQIEQMKEEKQKKLEQFESIKNILQPFIDMIDEEKKKKLESNISMYKSPRKSKRPSITKGKKSPLANEAASPKKGEKNKNVNQNEEVFIEENINEDLKKIPSDELLFNLLKYKIEKDFIKPQKEDIEKEINEYQNKILNIKKEIENCEKVKAESNKPNPKNDALINNLNQNLENMKSASIKGFILVDYPSNINQSVLLENYLTGYEDELQKPKTEKDITINNISNFFDYKIQPKENTTIKKSGIDFVINLKTNEKMVDQRFQNIKYDPITDTIYTDLNEENNGKQNLDKKVMERLVNEVPYLTKENLEFYKEEYNNNISSIKLLYNKFGMYVDNNDELNIDDNDLNLNFNDKEIKKSYQEIELETFVENKQIQNNNENIDETNKNIKMNSPKKNEIKQETTKNDVDEKNLNKAINFISDEIINVLYKEKDKADKIIFYSQNPEADNNNQEDKGSSKRIRFEPDLKINEINDDKKKKVNINQSTISSKGNIGDSIFLSSMLQNLDKVLNIISEFNIQYNNNLGKFIFLINIQRNKIYQKLNSYQTIFRDFLNYKTNKKKLIHVFINKYNEFFEKNNFFESDKAINEFNTDIEEISNDLWLLINEKEKKSIQELNFIKNEGFMQKELEKFHFNIKELFLIETEKFIKMIKSIIYLYLYESKTHNKNISEIKNLLEDQIDIDIIFKDISPIIIKDINIENLVSQIKANINIMFENSIHIIFSFENVISKLIEEIKYLVMVSNKKFTKKSTIKYGPGSNNTSISLGQGNSPQTFHEKLLQILQNEKNKYKYRVLYLKYFSKKYITIIFQTFQDIYNNLDQWIITNVSLQNDALNSVISVFKTKLQERQIIDEKKDIDIIEMDEFEKSDDNLEEKGDDIKLKPIDNNSVIGGRVYNKLNIDYLIKDSFMDIKIEEISGNKGDKIFKIILPDDLDHNQLKENDFYFDINKFNAIYLKVKKYEIEPNIIGKDLFYEIFLKQYCIDKYDEYICEETKEFNFEKEEKISNRTNKKKKTRTKKEVIQKEEDETDTNNLTSNLNTKENLNLNNIGGICNAIKLLNTKQQSRIYSLYKINVEHKTENKNEENKENKENEENKENSNEEIKVYEIYLNTNEIFTILALIGCKVLNSIEEENIVKDLKEKLISNKYLSKKDFMEYNFWFEKDFEYQNHIIKSEEIIPKKSKKNTKDIINKISIKEFIFNLWKDENGNKMDFDKFINILKINRYMTDINAFKEEKYYNIIFES